MRFLRNILLVFFLLAGQAFCFAQDVSSQQSRRDRLQREIAILDKQIKDNASKSASALTRLSLVQNRVNARQALVAESDREISKIASEIVRKQREINRLQERIDTMTFYYGRLVKNAYKNRDAKVWYMYILASGNLSQGVRRYSYLRDLSKEMNSQAQKILDAKKDIEIEKDKLVAMKNEAQRLRDQRAVELRQIQGEEKEAKSLATRLQKEKTKYQKELAAKKKEAETLERAIKNAINSSRKGKSAAPIDYKLSDEFASNKGKLPWPVEGSIVSRFGKQYHSVFKSLALPQNNGITIAVPENTDVKSVFNGTVAQISILPGYHQCVLVQHGNYFTLYSKIKTVYVKKGDKVTTGQKLGSVDTINGETVFHFEIWNEYTAPQNPEQWLRPR